MTEQDIRDYRNYEPQVYVEDIETLSHEEWLNQRKAGIGGSDCAAIFGASPWKTKRELYWDKIGDENVIQKEENWVAKEVGHRLEELVIQIFKKRTGLIPYTIRHMFRHPKYPWMLADVDAFVKLPNGKIYVVEVKTCSEAGLEKWGSPNSNVVPYHYEMQGRHYMAVTNTDGVVFILLAGNSEAGFRMRTIERDYDIEQDIIREEEEFWCNYVEKRVEPPYIETPDMVIEAIRKHFGTSSDNMEIPEIYSESVREYLRLKEEKALLDKQTKELKSRIEEASIPFMDFLQGHPGTIELDGKKYGVVYTKRTSISIKADQLAGMKLEYPDVYDRYATETVSVSSTVKEMKEKKTKKK